MEKFQNYIRINGEYKLQDDIPEDQMTEISRTLMLRLAEAFGYREVQQKETEVGNT